MGVLSGYLGPLDRFKLALGAGFSAPDAVKMTAISMFECANCDMSAVNASGDSSLWQINKIHHASLNTNVAKLADPAESARAAFAIWSGAGGGERGFNHWCVYPTGCGGGGPISWAAFNAKLGEVASAIASAGITVPVPIPGAPGVPAPAPKPVPAPGIGNAITPAASTNVAPLTNVGNVGGLPINVPSGLVLALLAVLLIIVGALLFGFNVKQTITAQVMPAGGTGGF